METRVELASVRAWNDDAIATERLAGDTAGASGVTVIANGVGAPSQCVTDGSLANRPSRPTGYARSGRVPSIAYMSEPTAAR